MNKIINILKKKKIIPIDRFIDVALYDKKFGYYMKKNPFGEKGDYITAPLVSNLFGEMIAVWCVSFWQKLGRPKKICLVELGSGDGTLCNNLLQNFKNFKNFYSCLEIRLLEKSDKLKKIQKNKIKNKKVKWIKKLDDLNFGPIIFLGNEFFDALPIKQIYVKEKLFFEKCVILSKNSKKIEFSYKKAKKQLIKNIKNLKLITKGNIIEYPVDAIQYLKIIKKKINKYNGGLLTFDYGYTKLKNISTLQSIRKHKFFDILREPGSADITSHVNYKLFKEILKNKNLEVEKVVTQNQFLKKIGIIDRANILSKKMTFKEKADLFYRLKKLLDYQEMGKIFKVLFVRKKLINFSLGFK